MNTELSLLAYIIHLQNGINFIWKSSIFFIVCRWIYSNEIVCDGTLCINISVIIIVQCRYTVLLKFNLQCLTTRKLKAEKPTADEIRRKKIIFITLQLLFNKGTNCCRLLLFIMFSCFCKKKKTSAKKMIFRHTLNNSSVHILKLLLLIPFKIFWALFCPQQNGIQLLN